MVYIERCKYNHKAPLVNIIVPKNDHLLAFLQSAEDNIMSAVE